MSKLDLLYKNLRRYTREVANRRKGMVVTYITLYDDGSGCIESKRYQPTEASPFLVTVERVVVFNSPSEGAVKLEKLLNDKNTLPKGKRRLAPRRMAKVQSP